ncbi:helix-turn-helix domain-containing protein [Isoptericola sp. F-RaC21]|uniref:helix-turn-helix domain-containing protein n=1 Tax=Isoptericola sp. F-RaC21 TaxID=3141452 RepID=UPI00315B4C45
MSKASLVITAVTVQGLSQADAARNYDVSPGWVSKLMTRYRTDGDAAFEPRSRRPRTSPHAPPSPCATTDACTTSESAKPTPEPTSCS